MVNNVASVGHAHPRVVEAGSRQMHLLNTNSRFHYRAITDFADRIAATLPDGFDTVFFVNTGSEATDLAIRLAMAATGRPDIVAMREAYHGWTYASDAVSHLDRRQPLRPRDASRLGAHRRRGELLPGEAPGGGCRKYAPEPSRSSTSSRHPVALRGMIAETYFGNAGGVALPDGYLTEVYAAIPPPRRARDRRRGAGRLRPPRRVVLGFQQQGPCPTSSRWRSPSAAVTRSVR